MQVEARINQDQNISKDLTLWNQQGSQVLRGQMLVLPIEHTFLYVEPIYIQASQAKMPQLKKVALAMGNNLVYADTYQQALAQLAGENLPAPEALPHAAVRVTPPLPQASLRRRPTPESRKSDVTCSAIGSWFRKASSPRRAKSWKRSSRSWNGQRFILREITQRIGLNLSVIPDSLRRNVSQYEGFLLAQIVLYSFGEGGCHASFPKDPLPHRHVG